MIRKHFTNNLNIALWHKLAVECLFSCYCALESGTISYFQVSTSNSPAKIKAERIVFTPRVKYSCLSTFPLPSSPSMFMLFPCLCSRLLSQTCNAKKASMRKKISIKAKALAICSFVLLATFPFSLKQNKKRRRRRRKIEAYLERKIYWKCILNNPLRLRLESGSLKVWKSLFRIWKRFPRFGSDLNKIWSLLQRFT